VFDAAPERTVLKGFDIVRGEVNFGIVKKFAHPASDSPPFLDPPKEDGDQSSAHEIVRRDTKHTLHG
jgi:hypothetical protein